MLLGSSIRIVVFRVEKHILEAIGFKFEMYLNMDTIYKESYDLSFGELKPKSYLLAQVSSNGFLAKR